MKNRPLHQRLGFAFAGLRSGWLRERSFRTHCLCAFAALIALVVLRPGAIWWALVALVAAMVMAFELINSAVEGVIDLLHPDRHPEIKVIKDMVAGAVLIVSTAALIVAVALLVASL
jgi:diacylglycerol kinase (ATP)